MSLKEDINTGLAAISSPNKSQELVLDDTGCCTIIVPLPASVVRLVDGQLVVQVKLSQTGRFFTFLSPIGAIQEKLGKEFFKALFYRQFYAEQVSGVSFAINAENDTLV
ncbi:MAG TPA: type III secretion system chaperone, partial [Coleofasciculaceae cyanobacterium]